MRLRTGLAAAVVAAVVVAAVTVATVIYFNRAPSKGPWVEDEVTFAADQLTIYGTYRHRADSSPGPAALLISESGPTDRNGDNAVIGPIGTLRSLAKLLSDRGIASLRYDKVGTGRTGVGPYARADVVSAVYTAGAKDAVRYLAGLPGTDPNRISVYGHGEGATHALMLAIDKGPGVPKISSLGLLQPLADRYLDLITNKVRRDVEADVHAGRMTQAQADEVVNAWTAAVAQARKDGNVPEQLPYGLSAFLSPRNVKAVTASDAINPVALAMLIPAGTPVLLTCSDVDGLADCQDMQPLVNALAHTALDFVQFKGVSHVFTDQPAGQMTTYTKNQALSSQFTAALDRFVNH